MAMRKSTRRELAKLREIALHFLDGVRCFFCRKLLLPDGVLESHEPGSGRGVPLYLAITEHHVNGNHDDNRRSNRVWAHRTCHRRHHASLPWGNANGGIPRQPRRPRAAA
jgi:hypothetical protein